MSLVSRFVDALRQIDGWPCAHVAVGVTGAVEATHGDARAGFPWASVTKLATAVADARRGRGGDRRPRRGRRAAGLDRPAPARACVRAAVRGGRADRAPGRRGGSTRTTASRSRPRSSPSAPRCRSRSTSRAVWAATGIELDGSAGSGVDGDARRSARARARAARRRGGSRPRRSPRRRAVQFPGLVGVLPGFRPAGAERLGARPRAPRRQVAALDGRAQLAGHVRPLRPQRHVPLGRSGGRASRSPA